MQMHASICKCVQINPFYAKVCKCFWYECNRMHANVCEIYMCVCSWVKTGACMYACDKLCLSKILSVSLCL